ncbi:amphi-Trp domain-containing protein [Pseudoglutamicibacter cumminsii]|uniref:amphi-Trp domain-containing protein n=1 Tax=Pseudoglutamicibacter cumminsii TaxID=156979 RepID=UPI002ABC69C4|nr:amphi-Trp domain-containing protein [Pseudoglutamicibacter cumminsii]MDZ3745116.1 amphi-Trp domain-containing protein [Pseudoglutamicibacter cumminsii]
MTQAQANNKPQLAGGQLLNIKAKETMSREQLANLLEGLAARIRTGEATVSDGLTAETLQLPHTLKVELEAKDVTRRSGRIKREFEFEMEWYVDANGHPEQGTKPTGISIS